VWEVRAAAGQQAKRPTATPSSSGVWCGARERHRFRSRPRCPAPPPTTTIPLLAGSLALWLFGGGV